MEIVPPVSVERFEQLEPGDLFVYPHDDSSWLALKIEKPSNGDRNRMVVLGPHFPNATEESFILDWQPATVISFGKNYSVLLPDDPASWFLQGNLRSPICLAVCETSVYVATNGGSSPQWFVQCFVELSTGRLVEGRLPGHVAYTNTWEIIIPHPKIPARRLLSYPRKTRCS